jgi:hypothetical protein
LEQGKYKWLGLAVFRGDRMVGTLESNEAIPLLQIRETKIGQRIMAPCSIKDNTRIRIFKAGPKPVGWIGKNWPCYIGYANSKGKYLVFTDADTVHSRDSIRDSVHTLRKEKLDVLTAVPKLKYPNLIVKLVLPILSIFMFSRYSPMRVNDPRVKIGYLFGSFFVISRECYERVGTHAAVKSEIVEDGALGKKLKEEGYKLKMFRGENLLEAFWARDFSTLWNSLKRLIIPLFFTDRTNSVVMTVGIFFLMGFPYLVILYCVLLIALNPQPNLSLYLLLCISVTCVFNIFVINYYQLKKANTHSRPVGQAAALSAHACSSACVNISGDWTPLTP